MLDIFAEVKKYDTQALAIRKALKHLHNRQVLVGIPDENNGRKEGPVTNAELLFIHTNGSPVRGIPARPVLEPSISRHKQEISGELKKATAAALDGNEAGIEPALMKAGETAALFARRWFTDPANGWAENSTKTIKAKGSNKPLIDNDEMRKSITYRIEGK